MRGSGMALTTEQEAAYALDYGLSRGGLKPDVRISPHRVPQTGRSQWQAIAQMRPNPGVAWALRPAGGRMLSCRTQRDPQKLDRAAEALLGGIGASQIHGLGCCF